MEMEHKCDSHQLSTRLGHLLAQKTVLQLLGHRSISAKLSKRAVRVSELHLRYELALALQH